MWTRTRFFVVADLVILTSFLDGTAGRGQSAVQTPPAISIQTESAATPAAVSGKAESILRIAGVDAGSGITYVLLALAGKRGGGMKEPVEQPPRLTGQCTRDAGGKLRFEVLANLGEVPAPVFYPPWRATKESLFPPALPRVQVTLEFLGYTHVKPVKRVWERLEQAPEELRYANPGMGSPNLEEFGYFLRLLRSLPTLRLSVPGSSPIEFETGPWLEGLRLEPLCKASAE